MLFRRTIGAALVASAVLAAAALIKELEKENKEDEDEVRFIHIDDDAKPKEENVAPEILEIAKLYPYLDKGFIAEQFSRNEVFNNEYPENTLVTISHKAKFKDAWTMQEYIKIVEENGYKSEALSETENIITKKMFTTDGAILSDIYNVANQVACVKGTYEGYKID
ncbi:MAG: hypothetical protein J6D29_04195 [Solobacterium sp.]|nr:hypothetical protein [Solobacterium sp.]